MSRIDTFFWKKFKLCDIFEKIAVEKIDGKANDFPETPTGEYTVPLLTAGAENQGLARYAMRSQCPTILSNVISVSANGANTGISFYQDKEFAVLQDAYAIKLKDMDIPNQEVGLFLASCVNKLLHGNFDWSNKAGWNNVKGLEISLPVTTIEQPDWDYMSEHIAELEQEHIAELEQYLVATGLNDYTLTDEDLKTLSLSCFRGDEAGNLPAVAGSCKEMREFRMGDLFTAEKGDVDLQQDDVNGKGYYFINSGLSNDGIKGRTDRPAKIFPANTISIDFWGNAFYRDFEYKMATHNHVFSLSGDIIKNREVGLYLVSRMSKFPAMFSYNNMGTWSKISALNVVLPIQTNITGQPVIDPAKTYHPDGFIPDWDYMAAYIKAIEKLVIKYVVDFKDAFIISARALCVPQGDSVESRRDKTKGVVET